MAEYWSNLNLFKPGSDDNMGIEATLNDNFQKIDIKLGDSLKDRTGKAHNSLGERLNNEQEVYDKAVEDVAVLKKKTPNERLDDKLFRTIAHRGLSFVAPENTLAAVKAAIDAGFYGVEVDIQLTSDGKWVLLHDTTIDRTSNSTGAVTSKTLATLKTYDFGSWFHPVYKDERIPTLEEFLFVCRTGNVVPYIELKNITYTDLQIEGLVKIIEKWDMLDSAVIISSLYANLEKVRYYTNRIALGYVTTAFTQAIVDNTLKLGNAFLNAEKTTVSVANMDMAAKAILPVEAWTVDDHKALRSMVTLGCRGITSNRLMFQRGY
ncbi:glycerophosphodiester phosphodiesterase [Cytobacillus oceanisediminis]|uniref:glycerophosphodiester phosphodiesterase n=1 Tax=Cytobacillus oceanisediminis TaxID=665099 RepID=UPI001C24C6E9|nr:glycerophosphodiester phosphodiesterase family protein [Cytobacillus oceanisediminis]MBU8770334.1 hypothetical protein [Cytobacillus oceanisediminis]